MALPLLKAKHDECGASIMEFGLIAPVVMFMLLGAMDIGHSYFVRATLDGTMQRAARSSSLEGSVSTVAQDVIDERVKESVRTLAPAATITTTRRYYSTFSDAASAKAEVVNEVPTSMNQRCDPGETFMDANKNGVWDADGGSDGQGGAKDIVIIKYKVRYPRLFPMAALAGWPSYVELETSSVLANQPYGEQVAKSAPVSVNCP
jgi:Flp pilus assembly pilin Flp